MPRQADLNVDTPEKVIAALRAAEDQYGESAYELAAAWQDAGPKRVWLGLARIMGRAAAQAEAHLRRVGYMVRNNPRTRRRRR